MGDMDIAVVTVMCIVTSINTFMAMDMDMGITGMDMVGLELSVINIPIPINTSMSVDLVVMDIMDMVVMDMDVVVMDMDVVVIEVDIMDVGIIINPRQVYASKDNTS